MYKRQRLTGAGDPNNTSALAQAGRMQNAGTDAVAGVAGAKTESTTAAVQPALANIPAPGVSVAEPLSAIQEDQIAPAEPMSITEMQRIQHVLGCHPGPADGAIGKRTVDALKKFQQANDLPVTGSKGLKSRHIRAITVGPKKLSANAPRVPTMPVHPKRPQKIIVGDSNMAKSIAVRLVIVFAAPFLLQSCSTVGTMISGEGMGEMTSIGNGQFDILAAGGLSADRSVTYAKWDRTAAKACDGGKYKVVKQEWQSAKYPGLLGGIIECESPDKSAKATTVAGASRAEQSSAVPPPAPSGSRQAGGIGRAQETDPHPSAAASVSANPRSISKETVSRAQSRLKELGFDPGGTDGVIGPRSTAAIRKFQLERKLTTSGRLTPETLSALGVTGP